MKASTHRSPNSWNHGEPLAPVLVAQLGPVPLLLLLGPDSHLHYGDRDEQARTQTPIDQPNPAPRERLHSVIRARHPQQSKQSRLGLGALSAALAAHVPERQVRPQVAGLADGEHGASNPERPDGGGVRRWRVLRGRVREQRDVEPREHPVVERVLEDVAHRHRRLAEAVHVQRLQLALHEVHHDQAEGEARGDRGAREGRGRVRVLEDEAPEEPDQGVDQERAEILDYEDGAPVDLRACGVC